MVPEPRAEKFSVQFEAMARLIFEQALKEKRCGELLSCLFEGGSATVQPGVGLVLLPAEAVARLGGDDDEPELCEVCDSPYHLTENHDGPSDV